MHTNSLSIRQSVWMAISILCSYDKF